MNRSERDQKMLAIKIPQSKFEAGLAMDALAANFDGGFHPDDDIRDIVTMDGAQYFGEEASTHYDKVINECIVFLDDIYETALAALMGEHPEDF